MAYTKQTWADLPSKTTPINAERLTHIEDGIYNAAATADTAASTAGTAAANVGIVSGKVETLTERVNGLDTAVSNKVDKVAGKGLSTNDYDNTDKGKVDSLGTASTKNSTSVVTESSDLVESGAVYTALQGKADNSVIAPVENGSTFSQAYSAGEHFQRHGAFCTLTANVVQGATILDDTPAQFTSGDVASELDVLKLTNLKINLTTATNNKEIIEQLFTNVIPLLTNDLDSCYGTVKQAGVNTFGFNCFRNSSTTYYAYLYANDRIFNALYSNGTVTIYQNVGTILS